MPSTIAAISTALAPGGIGVIRISGENAQTIADKVFKAVSGTRISELEGYRALFGNAYDNKGNKIDEVIALNFIAPKSFSGENVVELSCHGGVFVMKKLLSAVYAAGAAPAKPGEFTRRAFLNGKMDLAQAEAVMDIISAQGEEAAKAAISAKDGALSKKISAILDSLVDIGAHLAAWADYPDDDIPQIDEEMLKTRLNFAEAELKKLLTGFDTGKIYRDGIVTAIVGKPNAGKSTLMNLLAGCERSIVTSIAGTTRDIVEERVILGGIPLILSDTAGIRETTDPVESIGVELAKDRMKKAQLIFVVFDSSVELSTEDRIIVESLENENAIAVINKRDLDTKLDLDYIYSNFKEHIFISAKDENSLDELINATESLLKVKEFNSSQAMIYTERQRDDVRKALEAVVEAKDAHNLGFTLDAVTVSMDSAIGALLELNGQRVSEAVVDSVFEKFCVGK